MTLLSRAAGALRPPRAAKVEQEGRAGNDARIIHQTATRRQGGNPDGRPRAGHHATEQVPGDLVRAEAALAAQRARHAVLVLEAKDASFHCLNGTVLAVQQLRMVRVATVRDSFHARVIAARLGSEGMVTVLRGNVDGPYPLGDVHVLVSENDLDAARELLLADEVESAFPLATE